VQQVNLDRVARDLDALATHVEDMVSAAAGKTDEAMNDLHKRIEDGLRAAKKNLKVAQRSVIEGALSETQSVNRYAHHNVWKAIGIAGGLAFVMGLAVGLWSPSSHMRRR
jgi:ElaB/YqjD/DUF883 family membrane-anchored ribosome-binding protein